MFIRKFSNLKIKLVEGSLFQLFSFSVIILMIHILPMRVLAKIKIEKLL